MKNSIIYFCILFALATIGFCQKPLRVNNLLHYPDSCFKLIVTDPIYAGKSNTLCNIKDAQINGDCLEIILVYGGCNGNLELYTDGKLNTETNTLNMRLLWQEPSFCNALTVIKASFNIKPYKALLIEKNAMIKLLDTNFELYYRN